MSEPGHAKQEQQTCLLECPLISRDNNLWKLKAKEDVKPSLSHSTFKVVSSPRSTGSPMPLSYYPSPLQQPFIFAFLGPVTMGASLLRMCGVCV